MLRSSNNNVNLMIAGAPPDRPAFWYVPIVLVLLLIPCSYINMALFHTLVELFAVGIAVMSFIVVWNTHSLSQNALSLFLGCGYFWVGIIDLFHTLSFPGLFIFEGVKMGTTVEFWLAARFLEAFILVIAPFLLTNSFNPFRLFLKFGLVSLVPVVLVLAGYFPEMIRPGEGLTTAKLVCEYLIILVLVVAVFFFYQKRELVGDKSLRLIYLSIVFTILAELCFTLYIGFEELPIVFGHVFKLLSFWVIYRLLVESALLRPINSLYQVVKSYDSVADETVIIDQKGIIYRANNAVKMRVGEEVKGLHCHEILHDSRVSRADCPICQSISERRSVQGYEFERASDNEWYEASVSGILYGENFSAMIHSLRQISLRKQTELKVISLNRLYMMLSETNLAFGRIKDLDRLFQKVCSIGVNQGKFKMVWIGIIDGSLVEPKYYAGAETGYLKEMQMRVDDSALAKGPVGKAAKTKRVACVNSVSSDPDFWPWREAAIQRGYGSLAAVPILSRDQVIGLFTLYSEHENVFDDEMLAVLENLSRDMSSTIDRIEHEKQKRVADETISKLSQAVEQSVNGILIANVNGVIEYINHGFSNLTGYSEKELLGDDISVLKEQLGDDDDFEMIWSPLSEGIAWQGEVLCRRKDNSYYWALLSVSPISNSASEITHLVINASDNTELHQAQETIKKLAFYDPLTGLANRRLLMDRLQHALAGAHRHQEMVVVMLCDLDNFKTINDSLGHDAGDQLLITISDSLRSNIRKDDTVARLGGDEFVVILDGIKTAGQVIDIADAVLTELEKPVELMGNQVTVSSSIGIATYPQDGEDPDSLLRNADLAMYHAKAEGKNRFQFYQTEMNEKAKGRLELEQRLRAAIDNRAFHLVYQPQVELATNNIIGFEALIRWQDGDHYISPIEFIPLAEETGMIEAIGSWVIEQAIADWKIIQSWGFSSTTMAINVSAFQFNKADSLLNTVKQHLSASPELNASALIIEITESTLIADINETANTLEQLKDLGLSISIDDFGTGYSSLNYLKRFPIDQLKIDRSFVNDLLDDANDQAIVSAIIAIAQKLEIKTVAEGVEQSEQGKMLLESGCPFAQGFHYYKPMDMEGLRSVLEKY